MLLDWVLCVCVYVVVVVVVAVWSYDFWEMYMVALGLMIWHDVFAKIYFPNCISSILQTEYSGVYRANHFEQEISKP